MSKYSSSFPLTFQVRDVMVEALNAVCRTEDESLDGIETYGEDVIFLILAAGFFKDDGQEIDATDPEQFVGDLLV